MLSPQQVIPFLQHADPIVRDQALGYFDESSDFASLTADDYWAVIDRLGEIPDALGFAIGLGKLPQTDASLRRLVQALSAKPPEIFDYHYQHGAYNMELPILARNRDELLNCSQLLPHVRAHLELRLNLLDETPTAAWDRLMQHGRELEDKCVGAFNTSQGDALIEAAARGELPICDQAMIALADDSAADDWREIFAIRVLGLARHAPAVGALVEKLAIDADIMRDETNRALARIASPRVIEQLIAFYPDKPWHVRLYAHCPLAHIKRAESADALLTLLAMEQALESNANYDDPSLIETILIDLTELGSLAALDESRRLIADDPDDPDKLDLTECLLATCVMNGVTLPEEPAWRERLHAREDRLTARRDDPDGFVAAIRERWRSTGISFPPRSDVNDEAEIEWQAPSPIASLPDHDPDRLLPIRNSSPKIGRNDPCPCGSGKKYKKCCAK